MQPLAFPIRPPRGPWLAETARWAWRTKFKVHLNIDLRMRRGPAAETEAVRVFSSICATCCWRPPAGARVTHGPRSGLRSGVRSPSSMATGKVVATTAIYPHVPQKRWDECAGDAGEMRRRTASI